MMPAARDDRLGSCREMSFSTSFNLSPKSLGGTDSRQGAMSPMYEKLISGDNHIDLTYCPTDLWSSQAPQKWKKAAPRVEERNDGQHWFVDDIDRGMWNGVGPGFLPYTKGSFDHIDEMAELGFEWNSSTGATPRPTTPEMRIADLDRDRR